MYFIMNLEIYYDKEPILIYNKHGTKDHRHVL